MPLPQFPVKTTRLFTGFINQSPEQKNGNLSKNEHNICIYAIQP